MTAPPVLRVSALTKSFFGTAAVDDLYLDVHEGEIVALIGPSGCGKSTLLRCLTWLEQPDDGFIEVTGKPFGRELTSGGGGRRHGRRGATRRGTARAARARRAHGQPSARALRRAATARCYCPRARDGSGSDVV